MAIDVTTTIEALLALNSTDAPFEVSADQSQTGGKVAVTWKVWDTRWSSLLGGGHVSKDYRLDVAFASDTGKYTFTEHSTDVTQGVTSGGDGMRMDHETVHRRGKFVVRDATVVKAPEVTWTDGTGRSWTGRFSSKTVKEPVFDVLRSQGWRPEHDNWFSRLLEH